MSSILLLLDAALNLQSSTCTIDEATPLVIEVAATVSSEVAQPGDNFPVRLAEAVRAGDTIILPVGTIGTGQVVHATRHRSGGRAGELILAVRYLQVRNTRVSVRGFRINGTGQKVSGTIIVTGTAVIPTENGAEATVLAGTSAIGKVANKTVVPCGPEGQ